VGNNGSSNNKIAVITGGNSEIGPARAKRFVQEEAYDRRKKQ